MTQVAILKSHLGAGGGLEKYTRRLACAFAEMGCRTTLLTTESKKAPLPRLDNDLVNVVSLGTKKKFSLLSLLDFDRRCQEWLADHPVQHVFGMDRNRKQTHYRAGNGVHAAYLDQRRLSDSFMKRATFCINPLHRMILRYERIAFEHPSLRTLFANSHYVKQQILSYYATPPEKIEVVHNGVEWDELQNIFDESWQKTFAIRTQLGLSQSAFQLLFIGHGYRRKGLCQLLQGLALLKEKDIQLSVVGKDKELPFFQSLASKLGISSKVFFFGPQSQIHPFYQMADCLAIPSLYDPFANVTIEGLAMGLFVISSKFNGGSEILNPGSGTIIESLLDPDSVCASLSIALCHPKNRFQADIIRQSVKHLNFNSQLNQIVRRVVDAC